MATANAHFRWREWDEAAYHYDMIRKDYPKSPFQMQAHVLGLQSWDRMYQGPLYEATPLDKQKEIADQALNQFHGRLGEEEARVAEMRARVIEKRAEREWMIGQYYDNKSQFGAARFYYKGILSNYPQTQLAQKARTRIQEIQNEPDEPPKRFAWLTRLFERER
jgi:hypothetical protein